MQYKDAMSRWKTNTMFLEASPGYNKDAPYTLKDDDHELNGKHYKSFRKMFVQYDDEYTMAQDLLGGWLHWKAIEKTKMLQEHVASWREERDARKQAQALRVIVRDSMDEGSRTNTTSAKWLIDNTSGKTQSTRGRPSKEEVDAVKRSIAQEEKELEEAAARMMN